MHYPFCLVRTPCSNSFGYTSLQSTRFECSSLTSLKIAILTHSYNRSGYNFTFKVNTAHARGILPSGLDDKLAQEAVHIRQNDSRECLQRSLPSANSHKPITSQIKAQPRHTQALHYQDRINIITHYMQICYLSSTKCQLGICTHCICLSPPHKMIALRTCLLHSLFCHWVQDESIRRNHSVWLITRIEKLTPQPMSF